LIGFAPIRFFKNSANKSSRYVGNSFARLWAPRGNTCDGRRVACTLRKLPLSQPARLPLQRGDANFPRNLARNLAHYLANKERKG
jgi:hypothetical protein